MQETTRPAADREYAGFAWKSGTPESVGISAEKIAALQESLEKSGGGRPLLIARHDTIVHEVYREQQTAESLIGNASCAKSMVGGTALLIAMQENRLALDQPAYFFVPEWKDDPVRGKITIRHLASMSAGLDDSPHPEDYTERSWSARFWGSLCQKRLDDGGYQPPYPNPFDIARTETPIVFEPGTSWAYSNPGIAMLGEVIVRAYVKGGRPERTRDQIDRAVYSKIGLVHGEDWDLWYDCNPFPTPDGGQVDGNWGGFSATLRAQAVWARLMLRRGDWEGRKVIWPHLIDVCTDSRASPAGEVEPTYGLTFWLHAGGAMASGAGAAIVYFNPKLDLIVVYQGGNKIDTTPKEHTRGMLDGVIDAIADR